MTPSPAGGPSGCPQGGPDAKPTVADLGIDPAELDWERSGDGDGSIEIAFPAGPSRDARASCASASCASASWASGARASGAWGCGDWVLMRVAGDPAGRISVFSRHEWECFVEGARNGEFDAAAAEP